MFCDRILQAVEDNEKVRVFGDRDVDGITSTALLVTELRQMGLDASYTVPMGDDPYGMTEDSVRQAIADGVTLAITVDCGIFPSPAGRRSTRRTGNTCGISASSKTC